MTILSKQLRRDLETAIRKAREIADAAAAEALARIAVADADAPPLMTEDNRALRRRLRAHGRALGDTRDAAGVMTTARLQDAAAYEIWHRMLFGRFLVERGLLIHPDVGAAISLAELRDLAQEEGAGDEWALAEQYAAPGLPGVFKPDDPVLLLPIAPEFSKRMRAVLSGMPPEMFTADDSLGWTYQFWRASEKDTVNAAGVKIGEVELPAVTQLFTESYMVKFLLHNTLGAWWAGKVLAADPTLARDAANEDGLREACALPGIGWDFLRFVRDDDGKGPWRPAAGTFPGWPNRAAEITYCDPCCGSGHFLVEAFFILAALRRSEEELSAEDAAVSVLRDNLHGLELDGRCVQIAAFNVALAAWRLAGNPIPLPSPHIAWVGAPPPMSRLEMAALANGDPALRRALETLHDRFTLAPLVGTLLEVSAHDLLDADLRERGDTALTKLRGTEPERAEGAVAARGLLDASALLARPYVLLATNVPFLGRGKQTPELANYIARRMPEAKADLATAMVQRLRKMLQRDGVLASVTPQSWLFLGAYKEFRDKLLSSISLCIVAGLGARAFETISGEVVNVALVTLLNSVPTSKVRFTGLDANSAGTPQAKEAILLTGKIKMQSQFDQRRNPDSMITIAPMKVSTFLSEYADCFQGTSTGDNDRALRYFWEHRSLLSGKWEPFAGPPDRQCYFSGLTDTIDWSTVSSGKTGAALRGDKAWGKMGIIFGQMNNLPAAQYVGIKFGNSSPVLVPRENRLLPAIWTFVETGSFLQTIRSINRKVSVDNGYITKVPFDLGYWEALAAERYPNGLPEPYSDDPTQWLFHGHPKFAEIGTELHVALARLGGYRWPAETDTTILLSSLARERIALAVSLRTDASGLLPLSASGSDLSLADRLRSLISAAFDEPLSLAREQALVRAADTKLDKKDARDATLEAWLRDRAFRQHCILFQPRPFLWQIWDGMKDGFSAFLHYHWLDHAALDKLTFTLLGDWIRNARAEGQTARFERAEQLQQTLKRIIEGENPFDVFVRWKSLERQPIGWEPDLDDGVRLNIRPFMTAGILREQPRGISWNKDRGTDTSSAPWYDLGLKYGGKQGDRINDHHLTLAEKRAARSSL